MGTDLFEGGGQQVDWRRMEVLSKEWGEGFWSLEEVRSSLDKPGGILILQQDKKGIYGVIIAHVLQQEAELYFIYVIDRMRRNGISRELMTRFLSYCGEKRVERVFLEVRESNYSAIDLYRSFGFRICDRRKRYYSDSEDAFVMMHSPEA